MGRQLSGSCELCSWPGLCWHCPIRAGRMPRRNRPQSRLSCSHENSSDMPRMLVCSNHVFSEVLGSLGPLTPVSNVRFAAVVPLILAGQGTIQAQPAPPQAPKFHGLEVIALQHYGPAKWAWLGWSARGHSSLWHSRRCDVESEELGDVSCHACPLHQETQWLLALSPASALEPDSASMVSKAF